MFNHSIRFHSFFLLLLLLTVYIACSVQLVALDNSHNLTCFADPVHFVCLSFNDAVQVRNADFDGLRYVCYGTQKIVR